MTFHTLFGDFESEDDMVGKMAKLMGISKKKAWEIRNMAKARHQIERERWETEKRKEEDLKRHICEQIKAKFPDMHFKGCPWCHQEPDIRIHLYPQSDKYRVELVTCDHLAGTDYYFNSYDIGTIPDRPLMPNPEYTWMDAWENSWKHHVKEYEKYLSDDWKRKCHKCGKKWRGYEDIDIPSVDGHQYCWECLDFSRKGPDGRLIVDRKGIYQDMRNLSTMWDGGPLFYTSLDSMLKCRGIDKSEIYVKHKDVGIEETSQNRLSGSMRGDRYEIFAKYFIAFVFKPKDEEELRKYLKES